MSLFHELLVATSLGRHDLQRIIMTAPARYKVYYIPKKRGGFRQIAHPSRELKMLQRILLNRYLNKYPVHPAAMAYVRGRNIYNNADVHRKSSVILKLDFQSFFPSIGVLDWVRFLDEHRCGIFSKEDTGPATRILFWGDGSPIPKCLSIGAPTSPILSNILMYDFDTRIVRLADECAVVYTRYADDITISAHSLDQVLAFEKLVISEVKKTPFPRLRFNQEKRGFYTKGERRMVTGLVITPSGDVSIGRQRKRAISAMLHRFLLNQLSSDEVGILKGLLGFSIANEPGFVERMRNKYGDSTVTAVLRTHIPDRTISFQ